MVCGVSGSCAVWFVWCVCSAVCAVVCGVCGSCTVCVPRRVGRAELWGVPKQL